MTMNRRALLQTSSAAAALGVFSAAGCSPDLKQSPKEISQSGLKAADEAALVLDDATDMILMAYPETATSFGVDKGKYQALKSKLTDRSLAGQAQIKKDVGAMAARLRKIDRNMLASEQALNLDVVQTVFGLTEEGFKFPYGDVALLNSNWSYRSSPYAVAQNTGAFIEISSLLDSYHTVETPADADAYLERMYAYGAQLDGESERTRHDGEMGIVLPDFLMQKTLAQMRGALARPSSDWGIVKSITARAGALSDEGSDYGARAAAIAEDTIRPAIKRQVEALEALAPKTKSDAGVWAKPDGAEFYDWALRAGTTTNMSAAEVHEMGREELAVLHGRMDPILREIGYSKGSVGERMTALGKDKRYQFSDGDQGRAEIMDFIQKSLADIRGLMPRAFETLVPGFLEVTRIDPEVEDGAPGAYGGAGSIDGTQPGHFWINLRTPALHNKYSLADLTYHEAIPGHVWQGEYTFKQPLIRTLMAFNAYSEGWALYAEQLADELGVYDDFPVGRLGYLQSLAFRACRLVVDTGLHAKRWSREEAIDWFVTNNGSNPDEVQSEVDRYCAWPGQACGYKVGHSAINRLREKSKTKLGAHYDLRKFNDAVVLGGSVPMTVLGRVIDDYIAAQKNKP